MPNVNTTFANLKINCLRRCGNNYNANDATGLALAGQIINSVLGKIQGEIKGHPFTLDLDNTVSTVAAQNYANLTPTDILEILQVSQRTTNNKLKQLDRIDGIQLAPNPSLSSGVPDVAWYPSVAVDASGNNIWSIYFIPTPSSIITVYYDYIKDLRFTADGTTANAEFSKLPAFCDEWIIQEFKPLFYEIIDPNNRTLISDAKNDAKEARLEYKKILKDVKDATFQAGSARQVYPIITNRVSQTSAP